MISRATFDFSKTGTSLSAPSDITTEMAMSSLVDDCQTVHPCGGGGPLLGTEFCWLHWMANSSFCLLFSTPVFRNRVSNPYVWEKFPPHLLSQRSVRSAHVICGWVDTGENAGRRSWLPKGCCFRQQLWHQNWTVTVLTRASQTTVTVFTAFTVSNNIITTSLTTNQFIKCWGFHAKRLQLIRLIWLISHFLGVWHLPSAIQRCDHLQGWTWRIFRTTLQFQNILQANLSARRNTVG